MSSDTTRLQVVFFFKIFDSTKLYGIYSTGLDVTTDLHYTCIPPMHPSLKKRLNQYSTSTKMLKPSKKKLHTHFPRTNHAFYDVFTLSAIDHSSIYGRKTILYIKPDSHTQRTLGKGQEKAILRRIDNSDETTPPHPHPPPPPPPLRHSTWKFTTSKLRGMSPASIPHAG